MLGTHQQERPLREWGQGHGAGHSLHRFFGKGPRWLGPLAPSHRVRLIALPLNWQDPRFRVVLESYPTTTHRSSPDLQTKKAGGRLEEAFRFEPEQRCCGYQRAGGFRDSRGSTAREENHRRRRGRPHRHGRRDHRHAPGPLISRCNAGTTSGIEMVGARGFEPPTPWSRTRCSTRLSHAPTNCL